SSYNSLIPESVRRFPRFDFSGGPLSTAFSNEFRPVGSHTVSAVMNKTLEKHSLKFGAEVRKYREEDRFNSNDQTGQFIFDNAYTKVSSTSGAADVNGLQGLAAFLLGYPTTLNLV